MHSLTRRDFMRIGGGSVAAGAAMKSTLLQPTTLLSQDTGGAASDRVRFASIGTGTRGCELPRGIARRWGSRMCRRFAILYDSRHEAAQEALQRQVPVMARKITKKFWIAKMLMPSSWPFQTTSIAL